MYLYESGVKEGETQNTVSGLLAYKFPLVSALHSAVPPGVLLSLANTQAQVQNNFFLKIYIFTYTCIHKFPLVSALHRAVPLGVLLSLANAQAQDPIFICILLLRQEDKSYYPRITQKRGLKTIYTVYIIY